MRSSTSSEAQHALQEGSIPPDAPRDLAVYDPQVLITGVAFKVDEQTLLLEAIPPLDAVVRYAGGEGLAAVEITPADLQLLALADGRRTVRDIAERSNLGLAETARHLGRFRLAGVLEVLEVERKPTRSALAA